VEVANNKDTCVETEGQKIAFLYINHNKNLRVLGRLICKTSCNLINPIIFH
jgi:hypothetical protein